MATHVDSIITMSREPRLYGRKITAAWQASVNSILDVGTLLLQAKVKLPHGEFERMVKQSCPFGARTARQLMQIASHPLLSNRHHGAVLPNAWRTLAELARFEPKELSHAIGNHWVKPEMTREDVKYLRARVQKALGTRSRMPSKQVNSRPKSFSAYLRSSVEPDALEWVASLDEQVARTVAERVGDLIQQLRREMTDG